MLQVLPKKLSGTGRVISIPLRSSASSPFLCVFYELRVAGSYVLGSTGNKRTAQRKGEDAEERRGIAQSKEDISGERREIKKEALSTDA